MTALAHTRTGAGAPLVLLHGIGSSRHAWDPVIPALAEHFDVIAVDLPGFGDSEPLPPEVEPLPAALAAAVAGLLDDLGITAPHVAGNSLGGWVALELAGIRPVASLALLSPAGLWRGSVPLYYRASLRATRWLSQHAAGALSRLVNYRLGRALVLGQTHGRPFRISPGYARTAIRAMGTCPGFDATMKASATRLPVRAAHRRPGDRGVRLPRPELLRHQSRHLGELPPGTRLETLPRCGHVPMADDPAAVTALIAAASARGLPDEEPSGRLVPGTRPAERPALRRWRLSGSGLIRPAAARVRRRRARAPTGIGGRVTAAGLTGHEPRESAHADQADDGARRHELLHRHHPGQHGDEPVGVRLAA